MKKLSHGTVFFSLIAIIVLFGVVKISATVTDFISGYAWSSNIGWIKTNNCIDGTCSSFAYGLNAPKTAPGTISGYAWSSNIGWINFNSDGCPNGRCASGTFIDWANPNNDGTVNLKGWARACAVYKTGCSGGLANDYRLGGWDGYIALSGSDSGVTWGAKLNTTTGVISGYAWGSDVIGWVNLSGVKFAVTPPVPNVVPTVTLTTSASCVPSTDLVPQLSWSVTPEPDAGVDTLLCSILRDGTEAPIGNQNHPQYVRGYFYQTFSTYQAFKTLLGNTSTADWYDGIQNISNGIFTTEGTNGQYTVYDKQNNSSTVSSIWYKPKTLPVQGNASNYIVRCTGKYGTTATSPGYQVSVTSQPIAIQKCPPVVKDFSISASPVSQSLVPGSGVTAGKKIATFTVAVNPLGGFGQGESIALAIDSHPSMPASTAFSFSPSTLTWNGTSFGTSTLTVTIDATEVLTASYSPIVIKGTATPGTRTANVTIGGKGKKKTIFEEI